MERKTYSPSPPPDSTGAGVSTTSITGRVASVGIDEGSSGWEQPRNSKLSTIDMETIFARWEEKCCGMDEVNWQNRFPGQVEAGELRMKIPAALQRVHLGNTIGHLAEKDCEVRREYAW